MASGTVVVLPSSEAQYSTMRGHLLNSAFAVRALVPVDGPPETEAARICGVIAADPPEQPLTIVAFGASALLVPAVALAQRSAHRLVRDYVLVDPTIPPVSDGWPDAHVTVFSDSDVGIARLRGWSVAPLSSLSSWRPAAD